MNALRAYTHLLYSGREKPKIAFEESIRISKFDPSIHSLRIPLVSLQLTDEMQEAYIFHSMAHFAKSTPHLWAQARGRGISRDVYCWVNNIRGQREMEKEYNPTAFSLRERLASAMIDHVGGEGFFNNYWKLENGFNGHFSSVELSALNAMKNLGTDKQFLDACEEVQKIFQSELEEAQKKQEEERRKQEEQKNDNEAQEEEEQPSNRVQIPSMQELEEAEAKMAEMFASESAWKPKLVKTWNPERYEDFRDFFYHSPSDCLKINDTNFVREGLEKMEDFEDSMAYTDKMALKLLAEFDVLKTAIAQSRQISDDHGDLDLEKLPFHDFPDVEFFRREFAAGENQSHGILFLVDFSVSMFGDSKFLDTMRQVLILQRFCSLAGIKHSFVGFCEAGAASASTWALRNPELARKYSELLKRCSKNDIVPPHGMKLYEFFNETMSPAQEHQMKRLIHLMMETCLGGQLTTEFHFGRTPLHETILFSESLMTDMLRRDPSLQRLSVFLISDQVTTEATYWDGEKTIRDSSKPPIEISINEIGILNQGYPSTVIPEKTLEIVRMVQNDMERHELDVFFVLWTPSAGRAHTPGIKEFQEFRETGVMRKQHSSKLLSIWARSSLALYQDSQRLDPKDVLNRFRIGLNEEAIQNTIVREFFEHWC